ncbi:penicillin acylase family protein [Providencia rettgeri]|uniref:penicillin acylase family protein n=1 Tax=Providencia rettgeri TaxID=587 RepID=UPI0034E06061
MRGKGLLLSFLISGLFLLSGCHSLLNHYYADTLAKTEGQVILAGLKSPVSVRYNSMGVPLIKGENLEDVYLVWGYVHASERISHMELMRLTAQGRLTEYLGEPAIGIDSFMRKMHFREAADTLYHNVSPQNRRYLEAYANGVNAWLDSHQDKLPMDLSAANYNVPKWRPDDAILILSLANFGLAGNLHEEIDSLIIAQQLDANLLPWLFPTYPDEPLPHQEAKKLQGLDLRPLAPEIEPLTLASQSLKNINFHDVMASNNWAVTRDLTKNNGTLLANDTHLPIGLPSLWSFIQIDTPELAMAGAAIPGIPAIVLGGTPDLAWGYTMVMADNQDLFLEQIRKTDSGFEYLYQQKWYPVKQTQAVFHLRGKPDVVENIYHTQHGTLLNESLKEQSYLLQPLEVQSQYGIALSTLMPQKDDISINALMEIPKQKQVTQAIELAKEIKVISVNMLFADKQHIGWQLTGSYPLRKMGLGLFPSPGWNGEYDWIGTVSNQDYPSSIKHRSAWLATANQRVVEKDYPINFSQTWAHPERFERISELLNGTRQHDVATMQQIQYDQLDPMVAKLQHYLKEPELETAISQMPQPEQEQARLAQQRLFAFDGYLHANSAGAALYNLFLANFSQQLFADKFAHSPQAWKAFIESSKSYSAQADHLLFQNDQGIKTSPFWQKATRARSGKASIIAYSLAMAHQQGEQQLGKDYSRWEWGQLHRYKWNSLSSQMAAYLPKQQRRTIERLASYLDRGPYPAGGNLNTVNIASYSMGANFDTLLIPAMRLIVDFSQPDSIWVMNNTGQSANPASPHYSDNIEDWLSGQYQNLPFSAQGQAKWYSSKVLQFVPQAISTRAD